jgi:hypothetical protein
MKVLKFLAICALSTLGLEVSAQVNESKDTTPEVYTSGVTFIKNKINNANNNAVLKSVDTSNYDSSIATVGDYVAVEGQLPKGYVAFVKSGKNKGYFIKDTIMVECKIHEDCIPSSLNFKRIANSDLYQVKVEDYQQWSDTKDLLVELKNTEQKIINIIPDYFFGVDPKLQ